MAENDKNKPAPAPRKVPIWERRIEAMRRSKTTPLDVHEHDPLFVRSRNPEVQRHVRFLWQSDAFIKRRPMLTGFNHDLYQPVTRELAKEFELETSQEQYSEEGILRAGADANLYWAPEELCRQQDALMRGKSPEELAAEMSQDIDKKLSAETEPIGEITISNDWKVIEQAQIRAREGMGLGKE